MSVAVPSGAARPACPACRAPQADATARFCEDCGAALGDVARGAAPSGCRCSTPDPDEDGYCRSCGIKLAGPAVRPGEVVAVDAKLAFASDKGRRHPTNQDAATVARRGDGLVILAVADGVSTTDGAEAAARAAIAACRRTVVDPSHAAPSLAAAPVELARACVRAAALDVLALPRAPGSEDGPASTLVVAVVREGLVGVAWVGDSRAYRVMSGVPEAALTVDDSWSVRQVESGRMTLDEAMADPDAHAITQWLGMPFDEMRVRSGSHALPPGAARLLCSDGLWNYAAAPGRMGTAYTQACKDADAATTCARLVAFANGSGGHDNVTVAVLTP